MKNTFNKEENTYTISKEMMNCFKQLLFATNGEGVNLQGIISDITCGEEDDLVSCKVAFAFKGIKPAINKAPHFEYCYRSYIAYEVVDYSMILDEYKCIKGRYDWDKETKSFVAKETEEPAMFSADFINSLPTKLDISRVRGIEEQQ